MFDIFVNETLLQMKRNMQPYMAILGLSIMLMIKSHRYAAPHEQVVLIIVKQAIYENRLRNLTWNSCMNSQRKAGKGQKRKNVLA